MPGEKTGANTGTAATTAERLGIFLRRDGGGPVFTGAAATGAKPWYMLPTTTQMRVKHTKYTWSGLKPAAPARSRRRGARSGKTSAAQRAMREAKQIGEAGPEAVERCAK